MSKIDTLIEEVSRASGLIDPNTLAAEVMQKVAPADVPAFFEELLPRYVHLVLSRRRMHAQATKPSMTTTQQVQRSWVTRTRESFQVWTGTEHKLLIDCCYEDLVSVSRSMTSRAESFHRWSDWYAELADLVMSHKVEYPKQLPKAVLTEYLKRMP